MASRPSAIDSSQQYRPIDFSRSFLYCTPKGTDIWVRPQIECTCVVANRATGATDAYVLSVVAKTGLTKSSSGELTPGYDYWIIFSDDYVYTRRTHASSYCNNPTTLALADFGIAKWHINRTSATPLESGSDLRRALESWQPLVARTRFSNQEKSTDCTIEYPVKWADFNQKTDAFRVETGPVLLLDPERVRAGQPAKFKDFQWAHLDYHSFDQVRCMLDQPTPILGGASFVPPREHSRENRPNAPLSQTDVQRIETRLFQWRDAPVSAAAMRSLLQTDHYSGMAEHDVKTELYALNA